MHIIIRAYENEDRAYLAESEPPYTDWKVSGLEYTIHCVVCKQVGDEFWIAGKTPDWHTAIWRFIDGKLDPILVFPSAGDCGYPGMVVEEDRVLMSYYSQHDVDNGTEQKPGECPSEIYLEEIAL